MTKTVDPNEGLAADAALAEDLGDETERTAQQLEYFGGEKDDIDDFDATGLDDGSDPNFTAPDASLDDDDDGEVPDKEGDKDGDPDDPSGDKEGDKDGDAAEADADADADATAIPDKADADPDGEGADADADPDPKPQGIPKHRFDQVNERAKAAEKELGELKAANTAAEEAAVEAFDFDAAEKEYLELSMDGDVDGALAKRKEIRAAEHADWTAQAKTETKTEISAEEEEAELVGLSEQAEKMFGGVFDPDSENFNQAYLNKVLTYYRGYAASGEAATRGDAFVMGLADVVELYNLDGDETPPKEDPKPDPKPPKVDPKKPGLREQAHTPVAGEGAASADAGAAVPNIDQMTDEEIDALPAKTLARLRGDFV